MVRSAVHWLDSEPEVVGHTVRTHVVVEGPVWPFGGQANTRPPSVSLWHWRSVMLKLLVIRDLRVFVNVCLSSPDAFAGKGSSRIML